MFKLFKRGSVKPTLAAVSFDTSGYVARGEPQPGQLRVWHTPEGDGLGVYFFPMPPDLPAAAASVAELAGFFRGRLEGSDGRLVELDVVSAGGCPAVRQVLSLPQQPSGCTTVGSLIVPFRDFSFVIKCQCAEGQPTGSKETVLLDRWLAANEPVLTGDGRPHFPGFDPDDPQYDAEFPEHPVARARRVLDHVAGSLVVAGDVRALPGFLLPQKPDWWRRP